MYRQICICGSFSLLTLGQLTLSAQTKSVAPTDPPVPVIEDAKPEPLKPRVTKAGQASDNTVITSKGAAFFDSKNAVGVFTDDVVVRNPQFHMVCDSLEVFMNKDDKKDSDPVTSGGTFAEGGIQRAIAKGRKVVIQKLSETGDPQVGICRHATYEASTGDIVMRDMPQVQRGGSIIRATDASTIITLKPNGELKTTGPTQVDLVRQGDKPKKP